MTAYTGAITDLPLFRYGRIIADPPWRFELHSEKGEGKAPQAHYACMSTDDICRLPVGHIAHQNCVLFMWATFPMIADALRVMAAWGFQYKTGGAWSKRTVTGKPAFGPGYILRSSCEPFLIGTMGNPAWASKSVRNYIEAPTRGHSRKPDDQYTHMDQLVPGVPGIELYARQTMPGWDCWGNETGKFTPAEVDA